MSRSKTDVTDEIKAEPAVNDTAKKIADDKPKFSKKQILASNWYSHRRDILKTLLSDDKQYAHSEVERLLNEFLK